MQNELFAVDEQAGMVDTVALHFHHEHVAVTRLLRRNFNESSFGKMSLIQVAAVSVSESIV